MRTQKPITPAMLCYTICSGRVNHLTPSVAIWVHHTVPDRTKPSFVIFDIRALWRSVLSVKVPGCQKLQMTA